MPKIPKGASLSDEQKKKLQRLKSKGANKSYLATIRMSLLRGDTFAKAKRNADKKAKATPVKSASHSPRS